MQPDQTQLLDVLQATWPAARQFKDAGWVIREGAGGGQRTSAATALSDSPDIKGMEAAQAAIGQTPLVMIRDGEASLDAKLDAAGYVLRDPTYLYLAPVRDLASPPPMVSCFLTDWPVLQIEREIWAKAGITEARLAVMDRVTGPKTAILGRANDMPAGAAFVAIHEKTAMLHALEVVPEQRRQKAAVHMMQGAALWAQDQGADWLAVAVTQANQGAIALYTSLNMQLVGQYHYRAKLPK